MFEWELHSQVQEGGGAVGGEDQDQVKPWDGKVPERGGTVKDQTPTTSSRSGLVSMKELAQCNGKSSEVRQQKKRERL